MTTSSSPGHIEADDKLFEEAARWHIRLRDPDARPELHDTFLVWVRQDPRHLEAYDRAESLWRSMGNADTAETRRDENAIASLVAEGRSRRRAARVAGIIGCLLVAGLGLWQGPDAFDSLRADHIAWTGQRESLVLEDGTRIDLNSGTAIAVDFTDTERRVRMFRGEAFFDVAHDIAQPFVVEMPEGSLRVTGTRFNVDLTQDVADIALVEGAVTLVARNAPDMPTNLSAGHRASVRTGSVSAPQTFDIESRTAWRSGRMIFYRTPLSEVLAELGRYQRGGIVLMNDRAASLPVTGAFSTEDPAEVTDIIAETLGLSVHRVAGALTVVR